jgi:hypothetical protein
VRRVQVKGALELRWAPPGPSAVMATKSHLPPAQLKPHTRAEGGQPRTWIVPNCFSPAEHSWASPEGSWRVQPVHHATWGRLPPPPPFLVTREQLRSLPQPWIVKNWLVFPLSLSTPLVSQSVPGMGTAHTRATNRSQPCGDLGRAFRCVPEDRGRPTLPGKGTGKTPQRRGHNLREGLKASAGRADWLEGLGPWSPPVGCGAPLSRGGHWGPRGHSGTKSHR